MHKYIAQRIFALFWLAAFGIVFGFLLYKLKWYEGHTDDALSWMIQSFAPVGTLVTTVIVKDQKRSKSAVTSYWIFGFTLALSCFYVLGLLAFIAYADTLTSPESMVRFLQKASGYFAVVQGALVSGLALFFKS